MRSEYGAVNSAQYPSHAATGATETSHLLGGVQQQRNYHAAGYRATNGLDAVGRAVYKLADGWTYTIMLWLLSFVLAMAKFLDDALNYSWLVVFAVMWLGTIAGMVSTIVPVYRLFGKKVVTTEERMFLQVRGAEIDAAQCVDADSVPLFRRLVLWGASVVASLILIGTTQLMLYLLLVNHNVHLWVALLPLFLLLSVVVIYLVFTKGIQELTVVQVALAALTIGLLAAHVRNPPVMSWTGLLVPLWILEAILACQAFYIVVQGCKGRYVLERVQWVSLQIYIVALVLAVLSQIYVVSSEHPTLHDALCWSPERCFAAPILLWTSAVVLFTVAFTCVFRWQLKQVADRQGYTEPLPLSRTYLGWEPVGGRQAWWMLLGAVTVSPPTWQRHSAALSSSSFGGYHATEGPVHHLPPSLIDTRAVETKDVELTTHTLTKRFSGELNDNYQDF